MTNTTTVINVLENIETQWTDFGHKASDLAAQFEAVTDETDLEAAVEELIEICQDYPYIAKLFQQAETTSPQPAPEHPGSKIPPSLKQAPTPSPKEIANRFQNLLVRLAANG